MYTMNPDSVKGLLVKEWFASKVFAEKRNGCMYDNGIYAILKETEKAMYVMLGGVVHFVYTWVPKSLIYEDERDIETYKFDSFEACEAFRKMQLSFHK